MKDLRAAMAAANSAVRVVLSDIQEIEQGSDRFFIFDMEVSEVIRHDEFPKVCAHCGVPWVAESPKAEYCSGRCRMAAHRKAQKEAAEALIAAAAETVPYCDRPVELDEELAP